MNRKDIQFHVISINDNNDLDVESFSSFELAKKFMDDITHKSVLVNATNGDIEEINN